MGPGKIADMPRHETPEQLEVRERLRKIRARLARLEQQLGQTREDEEDTARLAIAIGVRQVDVANDLGRSREHIRKITSKPEGEQS